MDILRTVELTEFRNSSEIAIPLESVWGGLFSFLIAMARLVETVISKRQRDKVEQSIMSSRKSLRGS